MYLASSNLIHWEIKIVSSFLTIDVMCIRKFVWWLGEGNFVDHVVIVVRI